MPSITSDTVIGGLPLRAPERPRTKRRPVEAVRRFRALVRDKDDTEQVFHIISALSGDHSEKTLRRMLQTDAGRRLAERHEPLIPFLDDHESLARLPDGSLGRAYLAFMQREGLTAAGLEAEKRKHDPVVHDDLVQWWFDRERDLHDLIHVLTGYSRGAFGELCNLAFTYGVNRGGLGDLFIAGMGTAEMKRWFPDLPLWQAFREALRNGRAAENFYAEDIPALFALPYDTALQRLNIRPAPRYQSIRRAIEARRSSGSETAPYGAVASG